MAHRTPEELHEHYVKKMGEDLGLVFHRLWNDAAWLHMKWNEYVALFAYSPARMRDLNTAAPGFFGHVQDIWWHDMLLHICRMTEDRSDVLSARTLLKTSPVAIRDLLRPRVEAFEGAAGFARDARNLTIAHRNKDVALDRVRSLNLGSRKDIRAALSAMDDVLHFVEHHFCGVASTAYEYREPIGGVASLLDIVDRGLASRDAQYGHHRHPHPPDEAQDAQG